MINSFIEISGWKFFAPITQPWLRSFERTGANPGLCWEYNMMMMMMMMMIDVS